jgi:pyridoxine 5-phosphate synthase
MVQLAINIDHYATLREARGGVDPDPVHAAVIAEMSGAHGIVCHLREDRRHINDRDVRILREVVSTKLDLEMAATPELITIALETVPDLVTIVPERRSERTTEGGLALAGNHAQYLGLVESMSAKGIATSFFIEPDYAHIEAAVLCGASHVEFHTGSYANGLTSAARTAELTRLQHACSFAHDAGLVVTAGHGLSVTNLAAIAALPNLFEVSIGHAVVCRASFIGLAAAVAELLAVLR